MQVEGAKEDDACPADSSQSAVDSNPISAPNHVKEDAEGATDDLADATQAVESTDGAEDSKEEIEPISTDQPDQTPDSVEDEPEPDSLAEVEASESSQEIAEPVVESSLDQEDIDTSKSAEVEGNDISVDGTSADDPTSGPATEEKDESSGDSGDSGEPAIEPEKTPGPETVVDSTANTAVVESESMLAASSTEEIQSEEQAPEPVVDDVKEDDPASDETSTPIDDTKDDAAITGDTPNSSIVEPSDATATQEEEAKDVQESPVALEAAGVPSPNEEASGDSETKEDLVPDSLETPTDEQKEEATPEPSELIAEETKEEVASEPSESIVEDSKDDPVPSETVDSAPVVDDLKEDDSKPEEGPDSAALEEVKEEPPVEEAKEVRQLPLYPHIIDRRRYGGPATFEPD